MNLPSDMPSDLPPGRSSGIPPGRSSGVPPGLPSGTVTLFFSDIEGSTRLWEEHPDEMRVALERHDDLVRDVIERRGGYVFKTVGDAFCSSFEEPLRRGSGVGSSKASR